MQPKQGKAGLPVYYRWGLAAASGLLITVLYPPFCLAMLGWFALTPLVLALDGAPPLRGFLLGWLCGTISSLGVAGVWMFGAAHDYFQLTPLNAVLFTIGTTQIFVSVYFGCFGIAAALLSGRRLRFLLIPALFVATEYARAHLLTGSPWDLLGHSQRTLALIQLCDLTGVYGLSFLLALVATAVAELRRTLVPAVLAAVAVILALTYGQWRLLTSAITRGPNLQVLLVQANLANQERGRPEFFSAHLNRYLDLTRQATPTPPALIVWPENAIGFFPDGNPSLMARIMGYLRAQHTALLAGGPRAAGHGGVAAIHNSAYLFTADTTWTAYDKRVLLPFVERLPLRPADSPYVAGVEPTIFSVAGMRFGVLICFEAIYPELARDLVHHGAQLLVNISNDSWFEAGAGPEQHYEIARFRAVENRISLVRVTNSGVTGVIDPTGREIARLPSRAPAAQLAKVPIVHAGSFYTRHGDFFAVACIAASLISLVGVGLRSLGLLPQ
ncbi:MAG: apolipoprotein N-acyltransferase [Candidatus Binatia bacterium]